MNRTLVASSRKRSVPSSLTSARSTDGWASKSKSARRQGAGSEANRSRLARLAGLGGRHFDPEQALEHGGVPESLAPRGLEDPGERLRGRREAERGEMAPERLVDRGLGRGAHRSTSTSSA